MGNGGSVELPDQGDNIIRTYDEEYSSNPQGFGYELFEHLEQRADNSIAQIEASTGDKDTFGSLRQRCIRLAIELRKRGVTPEDFIIPCTSNHLDASVIFLAPLFIGAKVASLDPQMPVRDIKSSLDLIRPKFVFASNDVEEKVTNIVEELKIETRIVVFGDTVKNIPFNDFLKPVSEDEEKSFAAWKVHNLNETAFIIFSSGSTGVPKGICCSHAAGCLYIKLLERCIVKGIAISYSTLVWASAIFSVLNNVICGVPRLVCSIFEPAKTWQYIDKYKPVAVLLAPHDCISMIKYGKPPETDTCSIHLAGSLGGAISTHSLAALKQLCPKAMVYCPYGQSEIFGIIFNVPLDKASLLNKKPNTVGYPVRGFWYKIVDPITNKICGPNEKGELRLKTKQQMSGYYKVDSSDCWDEDGYLKTGDIAYYDEEHCFFIVERIKEVLRYKMHSIAPSYLEHILYEHVSVKMAIVIGIPSDEGDLPVALIVKSDLREVTEEELVEFVAARVTDKENLRGGVKFIHESEVLRTPSGKVRRYLMRHKILAKVDT